MVELFFCGRVISILPPSMYGICCCTSPARKQMTDASKIGRFIQPDRIYHGWRDLSHIMSGISHSGAGLSFVTVNGQPLQAFNFGDADFFEWGYDGNAPRMLALAILADYF